MSPRVFNFDRERWLKLANLALEAAGLAGAADGEALAKAAGRMANATPPASEPYAMGLCLAFRWTCVAFAHADAETRCRIGVPLAELAQAVRRLFEHRPAPPEAAAMPAPTQARLDLDAPEPEPVWTRRADIGG